MMVLFPQQLMSHLVHLHRLLPGFSFAAAIWEGQSKTNSAETILFPTTAVVILVVMVVMIVAVINTIRVVISAYL